MIGCLVSVMGPFDLSKHHLSGSDHPEIFSIIYYCIAGMDGVALLGPINYFVGGEWRYMGGGGLSAVHSGQSISGQWLI